MPACLLLPLSRLCLGLLEVALEGGACSVKGVEEEWVRFFGPQDNGELSVGEEREGAETALRTLEQEGYREKTNNAG